MRMLPLSHIGGFITSSLRCRGARTRYSLRWNESKGSKYREPAPDLSPSSVSLSPGPPRYAQGRKPREVGS